MSFKYHRGLYKKSTRNPKLYTPVYIHMCYYGSGYKGN